MEESNDPNQLPSRVPSTLRIAVIGGGTAGWMAAATLRRRLGCAVTLVESADAPAIGVGEATIPAMVDWIENMGVDEDDFLRHCGGTYKLAIRFDDWITPSHRYWHPFGVCGGTVDGIDLIHFLRRGNSQGWLNTDLSYTDFSIQKQLCERSKSLRPSGGRSIVANYAFHIDAGRLATYIAKIAARDGVVHRVAHVVGAEVDRHGRIERVCLEGAESIEADLFIDCSGFASVLIDKTLASPWVDWSEFLLCDRAVTMRTTPPTGNARHSYPYTISTGEEAGWSWQIPLRDSIGTGYVYSSRYQSDEGAVEQLFRRTKITDDAGSAKVVSFRVGFRPESWRGNCVSMGLASGFIEPLESTGIFLVQRALDELVDSLTEQGRLQPNPRRFNTRMQSAYEEVRDFVLLHYVLSQRDDTPFWRDARHVALPDSLVESMDVYRRTGLVKLPQHHDSVFAEANHHYIYSGADHRFAQTDFGRACSPVDRYRAETVAELLRTIQTSNARLAEAMPTNQTILESIHEPEYCIQRGLPCTH